MTGRQHMPTQKTIRLCAGMIQSLPKNFPGELRCVQISSKKQWFLTRSSTSRALTAVIAFFGRGATSSSTGSIPPRRSMSSEKSFSARAAERLVAAGTTWTFVLVAPFLMTTVGASRADDNGFSKRCIVEASTRLPPAPDLQIRSSNAEPVPAALGGPLKSAAFSALVHIDVTAAKQDLTYNFVCAITSDGRTIVNPYR